MLVRKSNVSVVNKTLNFVIQPQMMKVVFKKSLAFADI